MHARRRARPGGPGSARVSFDRARRRRRRWLVPGLPRCSVGPTMRSSWSTRRCGPTPASGASCTLYELSLLLRGQGTGSGHRRSPGGSARTPPSHGYEQALVADDAAGWAFFAQARGVVALERGLLDDAIRWWNSKPPACSASSTTRGPLGWSSAWPALAHAMRGEVEPPPPPARRRPRPDHPADFHGVNRQRARPWLAVAKGRPAEARAEFRGGDRVGPGAGAEWPDALRRFCIDLARLGEPALACIPPRSPTMGFGRIGTARIHHITGLATGDPPTCSARPPRSSARRSRACPPGRPRRPSGAGPRRAPAPGPFAWDATAWTRQATAWAENCPACPGRRAWPSPT